MSALLMLVRIVCVYTMMLVGSVICLHCDAGWECHLSTL